MSKKIFIYACLFSFLWISCKSTEQESVQTPESSVNDSIEQIEDFAVEEEIEEIDEVVEIVYEDDEYTRSTNESEDAISLDDFTKDKAAILALISELEGIMANFEYDNWKAVIDPASLEYYSNPLNLRKAQKKLPDKSIQLKGSRDYFKYVFIPSRKMSEVEEIRYISKNYIKAVQVREEDNTTIVYYFFVKKDGKWLVHLPEID